MSERRPLESSRSSLKRRPEPDELAEGADREDMNPLQNLQETIGNRAVGALMKDPGSPIPTEVRPEMESAFGRQFSQVRVHEGPEVDEAGEKIEASAFTVGNHIFMHSGTPGPQSQVGRMVLGEELAHVAQGVGTAAPDRLTSPSESLETQAKSAGVAAAAGHSVTVGPNPGGATKVARQFGVTLAIDEMLEELTSPKKPELAQAGIAPVAAGAANKAADAAAKAKEEEERKKAEQEAAKKAEEERKKEEEEAAKQRQQDFEDSGPAMPPGEVERMKAAVPKLEAGIAELPPHVGDKAGKAAAIKVNSVIKPQAEYLASFQANAGRSLEHVITAVGNVAAGCNALEAAVNPGAAIKKLSKMLSTVGGQVRAVAGKAKKQETDPNTGEKKEMSVLNLDQAAQLRSGVGKPLELAQAVLQGKEPDPETAEGHLTGVDGIIAGFGGDADVPEAAKQEMLGILIQLKLINSLLEAVLAGKEEDDPGKELILEQVKGHWRAAISAIQNVEVAIPKEGFDGQDVFAPAPPPTPAPKP